MTIRLAAGIGIALAVGVLVVALVPTGTGVSLLGRWMAGEFDRSRFDLAQAQQYVLELRSQPAEEFDRFGEIRALPAGLRHLSAGGEVFVGRDDEDGYMLVEFFHRRGINGSDVFVYKTGRAIGYSDARSVEQIAEHWWYVEGT